jgi:hypothetical protein
MIKDTGNFIHDADFIVEIYDKVFWVPLNSLGKSRYINQDMCEFIKLSAYEKKKKVNTLYEAVQLFQASEFKGVFDNQNHFIGEQSWQTHKSSLEAIETNEGCCATDTNWLSFFVWDVYDETGSFCYVNKDGNGHITTYIKQDGWYYFLDMMMCRLDSVPFGCVENGDKNMLLSKEWAGSLFKCREPYDYCRFTMDRFSAKRRDIPFAFFLRHCRETTATGLLKVNNKTTFLIPAHENPEVIYVSETPEADIQIVGLPAELSGIVK